MSERRPDRLHQRLLGQDLKDGGPLVRGGGGQMGPSLRHGSVYKASVRDAIKSQEEEFSRDVCVFGRICLGFFSKFFLRNCFFVPSVEFFKMRSTTMTSLKSLIYFILFFLEFLLYFPPGGSFFKYSF